MNNTIVLIPHFNNFDGLLKSLSKINFSESVDILVVDDGSKNNIISESLCNLAFKANGKIFFIYLPKNKGIEYALNAGLEFILTKNTYKFIARLDCGDICLKNRFFLQQNFLEQHTDIKLVGTNAIAIDENEKYLYQTIFPAIHNEIKNKMFLNCMFLHPTVMFCSDILPTIGLYPLHYKHAEDYAFFFKIVKQFKTANLQETLLAYEINYKGISIRNRRKQVYCRIRIILDNFYRGYWPIYGLLRNVFLYFLPISIIQKIKKFK